MYVYNGATWDEVGFTVAHDVPAGGATGTLLSKASATDFDTTWLAQSALTIAQSQVTNLTSDLALKAPLASPTFTGTPAAPTAAVDTNTTQVATTAFTVAQIADDAILKSLADAKGDLLVGTAADTVGRLAVGSEGARLVGNSAASSGVAWKRDFIPRRVGDYFTNALQTGLEATATATIGVSILHPWLVYEDMTISEVRLHVATGAGAGALWRIGIYGSDATGAIAGSLVSDLGTCDPTSTGVKAFTGLSIALSAGVYWIGYALQGSGTGGGAFYYGAQPVNLNVGSTVSAPLSHHGLYTTGITGAFPGTYTFNITTTAAPISFEFKRSA